MPVSIDEVTAEIEPPRREPTMAPGASSESTASPETELRKHCETQHFLECRAARVRAD
jgi:hypothetical protein